MRAGNWKQESFPLLDRSVADHVACTVSVSVLYLDNVGQVLCAHFYLFHSENTQTEWYLLLYLKWLNHMRCTLVKWFRCAVFILSGKKAQTLFRIWVRRCRIFSGTDISSTWSSSVVLTGLFHWSQISKWGKKKEPTRFVLIQNLLFKFSPICAFTMKCRVDYPLNPMKNDSN